MQQHTEVADQLRSRPLRRLHPLQRRPPLPCQRPPQQPKHSLVALCQANLPLQLAQDLLRVFRVAALRLAHIHLGQLLRDRLKVIHQRRLERRLLLRAHHHLEASARRLRVEHLLDAVRAQQRLWGVPRLHEQNRVADGADAVAEPLDVVHRDAELPRRLADHKVTDPELGVGRQLWVEPQVLPQGVHQRRERRLEEPAHKDGGDAHTWVAALVRVSQYALPPFSTLNLATRHWLT
mmetsp:Transcript_19783/g.58878  ORF Transcript_19783/g.58878 Transcript_19783/m.58878 type:complete len:236 (+) Transcript_19783:38-745(+)